MFLPKHDKNSFVKAKQTHKWPFLWSPYLGLKLRKTRQ